MAPDTLTELRQIATEQAAALDPFTQRLGIYRAAMADTAARLREELEAFTAVDAETRAAWTAAKAQCGPGMPEDPPALRAALDARRSVIVAALRTLDEHPRRITHLLAQIEDPEPRDLRGYSTWAVVDEHRRQANTLFGSAAPLRGALKDLPALTQEIEGLAERLLTTARRGGIVAEPPRARVASAAVEPVPIQHAQPGLNAYGDPE
jgi:hypothetical protein